MTPALVFRAPWLIVDRLAEDPGNPEGVLLRCLYCQRATSTTGRAIAVAITAGTFQVPHNPDCRVPIALERARLAKYN